MVVVEGCGELLLGVFGPFWVEGDAGDVVFDGFFDECDGEVGHVAVAFLAAAAEVVGVGAARFILSGKTRGSLRGGWDTRAGTCSRGGCCAVGQVCWALFRSLPVRSSAVWSKVNPSCPLDVVSRACINWCHLGAEVATMRCWRPVTTVGVVVCLLVAGCVSEWDRGMQALKADPMASASWEGLELLGTVETVNDSPKPSPPSITYCYKLDTSVSRAVDAVMDSAEQHGWAENPELRTSQKAVAKKLYGEHGGTLIASVESDRCLQRYPDFQFRISLFYS
uniref:hypothetical protein n=1 Tax=Arachnia propionica TaxID=1750 RepID=UPI0030C7621F